MSEAIEKATLAHAAAPLIGVAPDAVRRAAVVAAAAALRERMGDVLSANEADVSAARQAGMAVPLVDRLQLTSERIEAIASSMEEVARQDDPLGSVRSGRTLASGVRLECVSVPLGVVAMIYEARPNVTADAFALCARSGNACVLKGGSAARMSCRAIVDCCREGLVAAGLPADAC